MNPFVRDRIEELRRSEDPNDRDRATIMEMLCGHSDKLERIEVQTTMHNSRMVKIETAATSLSGRVEALERPAGEIKTVCKAVGKAAAVAVVLVGLATGAMTLVGAKASPTKEEIKAIVQEVNKEGQAKPKAP